MGNEFKHKNLRSLRCDARFSLEQANVRIKNQERTEISMTKQTLWCVHFLLSWSSNICTNSNAAKQYIHRYIYRIFQPSRFQAIAAYKLNVLTKQFRRARISSRFISRQYKQWCADSICNGLCYAAKWKTFRKSLSVSLIPAFFHKVLLAGPLKSLEFRHFARFGFSFCFAPQFVF